MLELVFATGAIGGALLSSLGLYISKLRLSTIVFTVAHAALAGAALGIVLNIDPIALALAVSTSTGLILGALLPRLSEEGRNNLAMMLFSLFNAVALLSIYLGNVVVLATARVGSVLWGSILAITVDKFALLTILATVFATYLAMFKKQLDAIVFDSRLAEAEGIDVSRHCVALIALCSLAISLMIRIVGGFLIFTLIYVPPLVAEKIARGIDRQIAASIAIGVATCIIGTEISYLLDLPIGTTIALTASVLASVLLAVATVRDRLVAKKAVAG